MFNSEIKKTKNNFSCLLIKSQEAPDFTKEFEKLLLKINDKKSTLMELETAKIKFFKFFIENYFIEILTAATKSHKPYKEKSSEELSVIEKFVYDLQNSEFSIFLKNEITKKVKQIELNDDLSESANKLDSETLAIDKLSTEICKKIKNFTDSPAIFSYMVTLEKYGLSHVKILDLTSLIEQKIELDNWMRRIHVDSAKINQNKI